jgi:hypothetical protein
MNCFCFNALHLIGWSSRFSIAPLHLDPSSPESISALGLDAIDAPLSSTSSIIASQDALFELICALGPIIRTFPSRSPFVGALLLQRLSPELPLEP